MWPVLLRELRLQARHRATPLLRVACGAVVLAACWAVTRRDPSGQFTTGPGVFVGLNKILLIAMWVLGPALTADCLARERRDGTLGLLFLTPLRPRDVVVGKSAGLALRAFTAVWAAVPVLAIPVLMGGVGGADVLRMVLLHLGVLALALTAGVAASALTREWWRARVLASLMALGAAAVFAGLYVAAWTWRGGWRVGPGARVAAGEGFAGLWLQNLRWWLDRHLVPGTGPGWFWRSPSAGGATWESVAVAAGVMGASMALAAGAIALAALALRRRWSAEAAASGRTGGTILPPGRIARAFHRRAAALDRGPAAWWFARGAQPGRVGIVLALVVAGAVGMSETGPTALVPHVWIGRVLFAVAALAAVAGFRAESAQGGFELLLPTPVPSGAWWWGRMRSLLIAWGPPVAVFALAAGAADFLRYSRVDPAGRFFDPARVMLVQYGVLPVHLAVTLAVGLRLALVRIPTAAAWACTLALTLGGRAGVTDGLQRVLLSGPGGPPSDWTPALVVALGADLLVQAGLGMVAARGAVGALRERRGRAGC